MGIRAPAAAFLRSAAVRSWVAFSDLRPQIQGPGMPTKSCLHCTKSTAGWLVSSLSGSVRRTDFGIDQRVELVELARSLGRLNDRLFVVGGG